MKKFYLSVFLTIALSIAICACTPSQTITDKSQGQNAINDNTLNGILHQTDEMPYLRSLIVLQNNELLAEKYINGGGLDQIQDIRSAAKSILSAILGIAIRDGYIENIDQKVITFFPEYISDELDPRIYELKIKHLIMMVSGFKIKETGKVYQELYAAPDWIEHIIHLPFNSDPGKRFNYHSFNTHLLSAIITKATGMSTMEYAKSSLFSPLGITKIKWDKDPKGYCIGGWGLSMTARGMAKFGLLYLKNGMYKGSQLVPQDWINRSTIERTGMIGTYYSGWNKTYGYGFLWWIKRTANIADIPFAMGHGGQRIAILNDANAVIVTQAEPNPKPSTSFKRHKAVDSLLFNDLALYLIGKQE